MASNFPMLRYIKSPTGRADAYISVQLETTARTMQVRADEGNVAGWIFARIVLPSGSETPFDFLLVNMHHGFPPERSPIDPYFVKAGVNITRAEWYAKLRETSNLVRQELWQDAAAAGRVLKGNYYKVDYVRIQPDRKRDWVQAAAEIAAQIEKDGLPEGRITAWQAQAIAVPNGSDYLYDGRVVTAFEGWDELGGELDSGRLATRIEPLSSLQAVVRSELFNVIEVVYPSDS